LIVDALQDASAASGSVDEEKEAQEEVQRLDSGVALMTVASTSFFFLAAACV